MCGFAEPESTWWFQRWWEQESTYHFDGYNSRMTSSIDYIFKTCSSKPFFTLFVTFQKALVIIRRNLFWLPWCIVSIRFISTTPELYTIPTPYRAVHHIGLKINWLLNRLLLVALIESVQFLVSHDVSILALNLSADSVIIVNFAAISDCFWMCG